MKTILHTKEQQNILSIIESLLNTPTSNTPTHEEKTLNMLAKKHNCNIEDIEIIKTEYLYLYYLNGKYIYVD
jgi:hypothetical protein